jgi:hypothetical protein
MRMLKFHEPRLAHDPWYEALEAESWTEWPQRNPHGIAALMYQKILSTQGPSLFAVHFCMFLGFSHRQRVTAVVEVVCVRLVWALSTASFILQTKPSTIKVCSVRNVLIICFFVFIG